jgi:hypothetical protein
MTNVSNIIAKRFLIGELTLFLGGYFARVTATGKKLTFENVWYKNAVNDTFTFHPPRRLGNIFHAGMIVVLILAALWGLYQAAYDFGPNFLFHLLPIMLAIFLVPFLVYRWSALQNAVYILERDEIRLQWGLRVEIIPTNNILWIRPSSDLLESIRLPWLRWYGSVVGTRRFTKEISIEFMASQTRNLILIGTYDKVFAVSPSDPKGFLQSYQRLTELGSLIPPRSRSLRPTFILTQIWNSKAARIFLALGIGLSLVLVMWVGYIAPTRGQISLGFTPDGIPREPIDGIRLMLLPLLNTIFFVISFLGGIYFFRNEKHRPVSFLLWGNSIIVAGLFLFAVYNILQIR